MRHSLSLAALALMLACSACEKNRTLPESVRNHNRAHTLSDVFRKSRSGVYGRSSQRTGTNGEARERSWELNPGISACNDFFGHVCSKEIAASDLEGVPFTMFMSTDVDEQISEMRGETLTSLANATDPRARMVSAYYKSCLDTDSQATEEAKRIELAINWVKVAHREHVAEALAKRFEAGGNGLVDLEVYPSQQDPSLKEIILQPSMLHLPKAAYDDAELRTLRRDALAKLFGEAGTQDPVRRANAVMSYERAVASASLSPEEIDQLWVSEPVYTSKADLVAKYPLLRLDVVLAKVPADALIRDIMPAALKAANDFLAANDDYTATSLFLHDALRGLKVKAPEYQAALDEVEMALGYELPSEDPQEACLDDVRWTLGRSLDHIVAEKNFRDFDPRPVELMIEEIRQAMLRDAANASWLSAEGRAGVRRKLENLGTVVGFPETEEDWNLEPVVELKSALLGNRYAITAAARAKMLAELSQPSNPTAWTESPLVPNAYYDPTANTIFIAAGIIQPPMFDANGPRVTNYARLGAVVAHEIGHSIDSAGAYYDENGAYGTWMPEEDMAKFEERGSVLIDLFDEYGDNGSFSLGENIADLVGNTYAFKAAFPNAARASRDDVKKFFIANAQSYCGYISPESRETMLAEDPHASLDARVNVQFRLMPQFSSAFQCRAGDKLFSDSPLVTIW